MALLSQVGIARIGHLEGCPDPVPRGVTLCQTLARELSDDELAAIALGGEDE
jgi:hypothetical protein